MPRSYDASWSTLSRSLSRIIIFIGGIRPSYRYNRGLASDVYAAELGTGTFSLGRRPCSNFLESIERPRLHLRSGKSIPGGLFRFEWEKKQIHKQIRQVMPVLMR